MRAALLACSLLLFLAGTPAGATSYVPMSDEALVDQAPVIAIVAVQGSAAAEENGRPVTEYRVKVERVLKGKLPGNTIAVRVPGGVRPDGIALKIWGAPVFGPDGRALLFLSPRRGGTRSMGGRSPARSRTRSGSSLRSSIGGSSTCLRGGCWLHSDPRGAARLWLRSWRGPGSDGMGRAGSRPERTPSQC